MLAQINWRALHSSATGDGHSCNRCSKCGRANTEGLCCGYIGYANRFATHRFGDERATGHEKTEALFVCGVKRQAHFFQGTEIHDQGRIRTLVAQMDAALQSDSRWRYPLRFDFD